MIEILNCDMMIVVFVEVVGVVFVLCFVLRLVVGFGQVLVQIQVVGLNLLDVKI